MIITIVADVLGDENNGTTIAAYNLIRALRKRGHQVRILCCDQDKIGMEDYYVVPTYNFGKVINNYILKNGVQLAKPDKKVIAAAFDGCDHVHAMMPLSLGKAGVKEARKRGLSVTAGFHMQAENLSSHLFLKNDPLFNWIVYKVMHNSFYKHVHAVHYPTEFVHQLHLKYAKETNAYVISNGVNLAFQNNAKKDKPKQFEDKYLILNTSRYSDEKCQKVLLRAVKKSKHEKDIQVVLAGAGPLEKKYRRIGKKLTNKPILNFFTREQMIEIIQEADLYVHPADIEAESIATLEAIAGGLVPVISNSKRSAARYFALTEENTFKNNSPKKLAERIDYWLENPDKLQENKEKYVGFTDQFAFETCMDRMEMMIIETHEKFRS